DRAVHQRVHHAGGDHRPAGLRADLRVADQRDQRGPSPRHGGPLGAGRVGHPHLFRAARRAAVTLARHQPARVPAGGRDHAVHDRARHGVRAAHRAARGPRAGDRGHARRGGHLRLPHGHSDDRGAGLDRVHDAAVGPGPRNRRAGDRAGSDDRGDRPDAAGPARRGSADADDRRAAGGDDHPHPGGDPGRAGGTVRPRRAGAQPAGAGGL
ncbi:MAG: MarC family integral membrane protein, partial [uncultured Sphingomonas sp.]